MKNSIFSICAWNICVGLEYWMILDPRCFTGRFSRFPQVFPLWFELLNNTKGGEALEVTCRTSHRSSCRYIHLRHKDICFMYWYFRYILYQTIFMFRYISRNYNRSFETLINDSECLKVHVSSRKCRIVLLSTTNIF